MIVDAFTQVWNSLEQLGPFNAARLRSASQSTRRADATLEALRQAIGPADAAIVHGFRSLALSAEIPAGFIARTVAQLDGMAVGTAGIDPMDRQWRDHLKQARDLGLPAISISPPAQGFHPAHTQAMVLYEQCEQQRIPVFLIHPPLTSPTCRLEFAQPVLLDEVARTFPNLRIIIGRAGYPFTDQTMALLTKHPCVYAELSWLVSRPWQLYNTLVQANELGGIDRLLLGSGFPFCSAAEAISNIYSINRFSHGTALPTIPREKLRSIVERDVLACLDLAPADSAPREPSTAEQLASKPILITPSPARPAAQPNGEEEAEPQRDAAAPQTSDDASAHAEARPAPVAEPEERESTASLEQSTPADAGEQPETDHSGQASPSSISGIGGGSEVTIAEDADTDSQEAEPDEEPASQAAAASEPSEPPLDSKGQTRDNDR